MWANDLIEKCFLVKFLKVGSVDLDKKKVPCALYILSKEYMFTRSAFKLVSLNA